ncbi:hypothetical protein B0H13DRAFT_1110338 [Mycena leptocephala]|nr:hypothetical protein B0H13DRAFT_1110338 [Mycena leptocephala]
MNRPRPSILQLFDPLSTRDAHSPDSDKENSFPDSDFFPQTHAQHTIPVRLTRRLVEVGDVTVDIEGDDKDGDEEDEEDENDTIGLYPPPSPRTPLGDVTFDRERTPMRCKTYRRKAKAGEMAVSNLAPDNYPFASVMNAVNASGATFSGSRATPSVVICPPEETYPSPNSDTDTLSTSLATLSLATPTGSLIADTTMAFPTPSEASTSFLIPVAQAPPASIASFNLDQSSSDLQTSFALHMNVNSDESFDLLNDQISFLGQSDEESFDMGRELGSISEQEEIDETGESLESLTKSKARPEPCLDAPSVDDTAPKSPSDSPPRPASPLVDLSVESLSTAHQHLCESSAIPTQPSSTPSLPPVVFVAPPARHHSPIPVLSTSLTEPPTLVPALKIVKRKRPGPTTVPKVAIVETAPLDSVGLPDPPAPSKCAAARIASPTIPVGRYVMEGPGPWRVPISSSDKEKVAATANHHKPVPGTALSGPRRVPLPTQAPIPSPVPVPAPAPVPTPVSVPAPAKGQAAQTVGALKRPLRVVPPNGSASGLPRAVSASRLPMPKSKIPPPTAGMGLPRRRVT